MEQIDDKLSTMKKIRKLVKRRGENFDDELEYKRLKKKSKAIHAKHSRLVREVKRLEELLGYDDKSTGNVSSSSSSSDEDDDYESA